MTPADMDFTVEGHFAGKAEGIRALYDRLLELLGSFGPIVVEPKKTCIHLARKTALAGVYVRKDYINLEFKTDYPIESDLISKSEQISKNRYHHVTRLASPEALGGDLCEWLRDAYSISG